VLFLLTRNTHSFAKQSPENLDGFPESRNAFPGRNTTERSLQKVLETVSEPVHETNKLYAANYNSLYLLSGTYQYRFDTTNAVVANAEANVAAGNDSWNTPIDSNYVIAPKSNPLPIIAGALLDLQNATFAMVAAGDSVVFRPCQWKCVSERRNFCMVKTGSLTGRQPAIRRYTRIWTVIPSIYLSRNSSPRMSHCTTSGNWQPQ
jgi:hypothetical protein